MRLVHPRAALGALLALALFLCVSVAFAGSVTLTWSNPTTRTDGSPVTVAQVKVYRGATCSTQTALATIPAATTYTDTNVAAGSYCYAVSALDAGGLESAKSVTTTAVVPVAPPNPPAGLTVTAVVAGLNMAPAYRINADGSRGSAVLGFVPTGTACTGSPVYSYRGVTYARVDPARVKWWGTSPTPNVAAPCKAA
jgi:hypothetical protein